MSLGILYADELSGFYKSKVMLVLWVGMPVMALVLHAVSPDLRGQMTLAQFSMLLIATIASTISAVMLSVGIITEKTRGVYALFLVRPVRRWCILVGKFLAVFTCVAVASVLTLLVGVLFDWLRGAAHGCAHAGRGRTGGRDQLRQHRHRQQRRHSDRRTFSIRSGRSNPGHLRSQPALRGRLHSAHPEAATFLGLFSGDRVRGLAGPAGSVDRILPAKADLGAAWTA